MPFFEGYTVLLMFLSATARNWDFTLVSEVRNAAAWSFVALVAGMGGYDG